MNEEAAIQSKLKSLIILFKNNSQQFRQRSVGEIYSNYKTIYWLPAPLEDSISLLFFSLSALLSLSNLSSSFESYLGSSRSFCNGEISI